MLEEKLYFVENIDATVIAQAPKLRPYIEDMRENIAKALETDIDRVNIKATTEEHMGFTGRGEGIAAQAVCLLTSPSEMGYDTFGAQCMSGCGCPMKEQTAKES